MTLPTSDVYRYRRVIRRQMMLERGGICDMCGKKAAEDVHEICARGMTRRGSDERWASYDKHICSILCRDCHDKAHSPDGRTVLFKANIERYGYESVKEAFDAVGLQGIDFPEREDNEPTTA